MDNKMYKKKHQNSRFFIGKADNGLEKTSMMFVPKQTTPDYVKDVPQGITLIQYQATSVPVSTDLLNMRFLHC